LANVNNLFGFRPINRESGGPIFTRQYGKPSSDGTAIFMNDIVTKAAVSVPDPTGLGNPSPGITSGQGATPGTSLYLGTSVNFGAASTATTHYVVDDIDTVFISQVDSTTNVTAAADAGKNVNLKTGTGNALTKQSTMGLDHTSIATTAGLDFRILRVSNISPNAEGVFAICEVIILKHALGQGTAGV
jgi:hypothetical protein